MIKDPEQILLEAISGFRELHPTVGQLEVLVPGWWADLHGRDVVTEHAARYNATLHVVELMQMGEKLQMLVYPKGSFVSKRGSMIDLVTTPRGYTNIRKHRVYKYGGGWWFTCALCLASKPVVAWRQALDLLWLHVDGHVRAHRPS